MRAVEPIIRIRNLQKWFGSLHVLKGIHLEVAPGEKLVIIGPSGSGKSTLLNILGGLDEEYSGTVQYAPEVFRETEIPFPFVFQESHSLLPWKSVEDNVRIAGKRLTQARIEEALTSVGLYEHREKKPGELSGGMKQRVSLARALVCNARVMLLDEPFASLDEEMRRKLQELIKGLSKSKNIAMVLVTHERSEAETMADRIIFL